MISIMNPIVPQTDQQVRDKIGNILEQEHPDVIFPSGYPTAFRGLYFDSDLEQYGVVYSREAMVITLMREDKMSDEEALEFLEFNTFNTYVGGGDYAQPQYIYE